MGEPNTRQVNNWDTLQPYSFLRWTNSLHPFLGQTFREAMRQAIRNTEVKEMSLPLRDPESPGNTKEQTDDDLLARVLGVFLGNLS